MHGRTLGRSSVPLLVAARPWAWALGAQGELGRDSPMLAGTPQRTIRRVSSRKLGA